MNDFLHSLRGNKDKRFDRSRRNYESPSYRSNDRHNTMDKRRKAPYRPQQNEQAQVYASINKLLPTIKTLLESFTEERKRLIAAEERKAVAMEAIATFLQQFSSGTNTDVLQALESIEPSSENGASEPAHGEASRALDNNETPPMERSLNTESDRSAAETAPLKVTRHEELALMINGLRKQGFSYEKIARHFEDNAVPTISGRGKWRGQAVSKLCQ